MSRLRNLVRSRRYGIIVGWLFGCALAIQDREGLGDDKPLEGVTFLTNREGEFYTSEWKPAIGEKGKGQSIEESLKREVHGIANWLCKEVNVPKGKSMIPVVIHVVSIDGPRKIGDERGIMNVERAPGLAKGGEVLVSWTRVDGPDVPPKIAVTGVVQMVDDKSLAAVGIYSVRRIFEYRGQKWVEQVTSTDLISGTSTDGK